MTFHRPTLAASAFFAAAILLAAAPAARAEKQWRKYTDCTLIDSKGNDGDSFHVDCGSLKSAKSRHKLIRLYFVDTPESDDSLPERLEEQRKYWNLPDTKTVVKMGKEAHRFTDNALKNGFTVYSRLADALGRSKIGRDAGMVWIDSLHEDLGYLLVRNGLARPGSWKTDLSEIDVYKKGEDSWARRIHMAEADARRERKGCWAYSQSGTGAGPFAGRLPAPGPAPAVAPPAVPAQPVIPPVARPPSAAAPRPALPPAAPPSAPAPAIRPGSMAAATAARMDALTRPPAVRPQDVVTTRPVTIYDATKLPSAVPLGQLRAGVSIHVHEAVNPSLVRVSFTTSSGRAISGIARLAELPPSPPEVLPRPSRRPPSAMSATQHRLPSPPTRAFVLCAGFGTRLRPFTRATPKPLAPLWGVPLVQRVCDALAAWGVREVLLNLHHLPGPLREWADAHSTPDFAIRTIEEPDILGTAGALRNAADAFPDFFSAPLWVVNGDIAFRNVRPAPFLRALAAAPDASAACWLTPAAGPRTVLAPPPSSVIADFRAPAGTGDTFCGLQLVRPAFLLPHVAPGFDALPDAYVRAAAAGHPALGVRIPRAWWADLGTPDQLVQAHRDTARALAPSPAAPIRLPPAAVLPELVHDALAAAPDAIGGPLSAASVIPLPPRGSSRVFYRLDPRRGAPRLVCVWSPDRPDNALYAPVTRFLAARGVPVPRLFLDDPASRTLVFEWLPGGALEDRLRDRRTAPLPRLRAALDAVAALHRAGRAALAAPSALPPLSPPYDASLAAWERDYYATAFLRGHCAVPDRAIRRAADALDALAPALLSSPQTLIHRDLQSSNILFRDASPARPVFIDYQGLRPGPAAYDLASFLFDPYLEAVLSPATRQDLARRYADAVPDGPAVLAALLPAAATRLCQALGAYATLSRRPGMARFAAYIPPALRLLRDVLSALPPAFRPILPASVKP